MAIKRTIFWGRTRTIVLRDRADLRLSDAEIAAKYLGADLAKPRSTWAPWDALMGCLARRDLIG